jgi:DNA/RNA endonuclease YhcR with UshA esterase domain
MNVANLTQQDIKQIQILLAKREALQAQLAAYNGGRSATKHTDKANSSSINRQHKRGALKEAIIQLLKSSGQNGITVKDIAARLNTNTGNIHVWFTSTGKSIKEIKKVAPATYVWAN